MDWGPSRSRVALSSMSLDPGPHSVRMGPYDLRFRSVSARVPTPIPPERLCRVMLNLSSGGQAGGSAAPVSRRLRSHARRVPGERRWHTDADSRSIRRSEVRRCRERDVPSSRLSRAGQAGVAHRDRLDPSDLRSLLQTRRRPGSWWNGNTGVGASSRCLRPCPLEPPLRPQSSRNGRRSSPRPQR